MSWTFAALVIVGLALAAGFAWYERSRPPAKVVALVATLAALAAVGRVAFAPLPNVKPTTDVVLIAGYALGGAPGFVVGAVSALASNLFFGQGPWTPWQMVAWGLVGVLGAGLARAGGRRMRRVPLALWCGAAGVGFGWIMNLSTWVTFTGDHTLGEYVALCGTALPWDLAHAAGNVAFFLAFGPALVRALERFRARFAVRWQAAPAPLAVAVAAVVAAGGLLAAPAHAASPGARAAAYLRGAENADGGWGPAPGTRSTGLVSAWAAIGLAAAGQAPGDAARAYAERQGALVRSPADVERAVLAVAAAGGDPAALAQRLRAKRRADGSFAGLTNVTSFAVLALRAAGAPASDPVVRGAARWVARQQNRDGGFSFYRRGSPSGTDDTSAAVMALVAAGRRGTPAVARGARYLTAQRGRDGGWPLVEGGASNSQSTAWAVQALIAAGRGGIAPGLAFLRRMQAPSGAVRYSRVSNQTPVWVTADALAALSRRPLPVGPPAASGVRPGAPAATARSAPSASGSRSAAPGSGAGSASAAPAGGSGGAASMPSAAARRSAAARAAARRAAARRRAARAALARPADPAALESAMARALAPEARAAGRMTYAVLAALQVD